jgi:hypothetical protein
MHQQSNTFPDSSNNFFQRRPESFGIYATRQGKSATELSLPSDSLHDGFQHRVGPHRASVLLLLKQDQISETKIDAD